MTRDGTLLKVAIFTVLMVLVAAFLVVVLLLITLFAILGLSFVLYADSAATSARLARQAESRTDPDVSPDGLLAWFLGQMIYDVPDGECLARVRTHEREPRRQPVRLVGLTERVQGDAWARRGRDRGGWAGSARRGGRWWRGLG